MLHLFSGSLPPSEDYTRFDIRPEMEPDVVGDAHALGEHFDSDAFDLIYADPPYSVEDAERYGTPMVKRRKIMASVKQILEPGGWLVWLDQAWPQFSKADFIFRGAIGAVRSTNHRVRAVFFFERCEEEFEL